MAQLAKNACRSKNLRPGMRFPQAGAGFGHFSGSAGVFRKFPTFFGIFFRTTTAASKQPEKSPEHLLHRQSVARKAPMQPMQRRRTAQNPRCNGCTGLPARQNRAGIRCSFILVVASRGFKRAFAVCRRGISRAFDAGQFGPAEIFRALDAWPFVRRQVHLATDARQICAEKSGLQEAK